MNPFEQPVKPLASSFIDWKALYPASYNKKEVDPFTKTRVILMNGTEFEANWFSHQFARHCMDADLRRALALTRRIEQQQQKALAVLKPIDETILEHTISYEQLAVELTAILAQREPDPNVKAALDFALLEDFDHLYRYADLLEQEKGVYAENLVGRYTEIMPGRPTISEHRFPYDNVRAWANFKDAAPITKLDVSIITASEQQTMNYYMNVAGFYENDVGRRLYQEIGLIEEQHVTQYESLADPSCTWLEMLLMHEYTECYLYYSCYMDETDPRIKTLWEMHFEQECAHLQEAARLLEAHEGKQWQQAIPQGEFPDLLRFHGNVDYIRGVLASSVRQTSVLENYVNIADVPCGAEFFKFQAQVNAEVNEVPSHMVIQNYIANKGMDYRFETAPHPIDALRDRKCDNTQVGRCKDA